MKLGCSSWSYHQPIKTGRLTQLDWLRLCRNELALDGVELLDLHFPTTDTAYLRDLKRLCAGLHLTISCASVSNDFGLAAPEAREQELIKVKRSVDIAFWLGAPVLRVFAGWPRPDGRASARGDKQALWPEMVAHLREAAEYGFERGVVLGLENHDGGGFVGTTDEVERCLGDVGSPWLRLNLDTGDFGDVESVRRTAHHAVHVHAKLYDLDEAGVERRLDWPAVLDILREAGYSGFLSIEYEGEEPAESTVPRGVRYLRRLLAGG
ncbi:MAG: sugar phosphate isomerase/epimerase [Chloroflexi bacterium]|nr:sugar phosphate isomerase/epimerase [Chloroflexota bacterium]